VIVVDASALVEVLVKRSGAGDAVAERMRDESVNAPSLIDAEVLSTLRRMNLSGKLPEGQAKIALQLLDRMPIQRTPLTPHLPRAWQLRSNVGAYDAMYVALAETLRCPLVTADARLSRASGLRCKVEAYA